MHIGLHGLALIYVSMNWI